MTAVVAPVVSPVWAASFPAVVGPPRPSRSRHSRSVGFAPTSLATVSLSKTDPALTFRRVSSSALSNSSRAGGDLVIELSNYKYLKHQDTCRKRGLWCKALGDIREQLVGRAVNG